MQLREYAVMTAQEAAARVPERSAPVLRHLSSAAGYDAVSMRKRCKSAMIFVPSVQGISHNEAELTHPQDLANGLEMLGEVLLRLVRGEGLAFRAAK